MSRNRFQLDQPAPSQESIQEAARFQAQHEARNRDLRAEELLKANDAQKAQEGRYIEHGPLLVDMVRALRGELDTRSDYCLDLSTRALLLLAAVEGK